MGVGGAGGSGETASTALLAVWLGTKARFGKPEHAHCAPSRTFCVAEDNNTTSVAEDSIITSGGVKVSQSRMSFFVRSKGNSCFSFHQGVGGMQAIVSGWISSHGPSVLWIREGA